MYFILVLAHNTEQVHAQLKFKGTKLNSVVIKFRRKKTVTINLLNFVWSCLMLMDTCFSR